MERRSRESAVALAADREEGSALLGGAVPRFASLPTQAERILAERLAAELGQGPEGARRRAASRLADIAGEEAVPLLVDALPGAGPALRAALADALGRAGGPEAIRAVEELGDDPDPLVRAAAVDASARLLADDPASLADALRAALADDDPKVRRRAVLQAAAARGIDPGELLAPVLDDDDRHARRLAAVALGATRRPEAALALVDALLDEDESVRAAAAGSAALLFGADAARIAGMAPLQRGRAVARLKAQVAANPSMFAQPGATSPAPSREEFVARREGTPSHRAVEPEPEPEPAREAARLTLLDAEPAARVDHELDEDVQAVMRALTLAGSFGGAGCHGAEGDAALDAANGAASGTANGAAIDAVNDAASAVGLLNLTSPEDDAAAPAPAADEASGGHDFREIEAIVRSALRGVTPDDLARELDLSPLALGPVLEDHLEAGRLVRRGKKLFLP